MSDTAAPPAKGSAAFWDSRYIDEPDRYGEAPNAFLAERARDLAPGRAFLPADGQGRNGLFLAAQGFAVSTRDLSPVAVARTREKAAARGLSIDAAVGDVAAHPPAEAAFDLVAIIFFHTPSAIRRAIHAAAARALKPGGALLIEGFSPRHLTLDAANRSAGPSSPDVMFSPETLRAEFAGLEPLFCEEADVVLREGIRHDGPAIVTRGHFRRP